jgi:maltose phosphorylase
MKRIFEIDPWLVQSHQLNPNEKRLQESMTAIGNGYMGLRGNFEEGYSGDHLQGTYLGGVWFPDKTVVGWWKKRLPGLLRQGHQRAELHRHGAHL